MPEGLDFATLPQWCVFTAPNVVARALDVVGWLADADLRSSRLLEPAAGDGAFVAEAIARLLQSMARRGVLPSWASLKGRITCFEIEPVLARSLRSNVQTALTSGGVPESLAVRLAKAWCLNADFLQAEIAPGVTHAVGNPPFKRGGGASPDLCVRFVERSFSLLSDGGRMAILAPISLGSSAGGKAMRRLIEDQGRLEALETYEAREAFTRRVSVCGGLFVIRRERAAAAFPVTDTEPTWQAGSPEARAAFAAAARRYPALEDAGCRVRLGMVTGKNRVFVGTRSDLDVEEDLLVPVVGTRDLVGARIEWQGLHVIDTSGPSGVPWDAQEKPKLDTYLERHRSALEARYTVAQGDSWRVTHSPVDHRLTASPKVLVAETARPCRVSFDAGGHMPLNTIHAITSWEWPPEALLTLLSTAGVGLLANALCLKRGGYLRVNATALRQVRIPRWKDLSDVDKQILLGGDSHKACEVSARIYKMSDALLRRCMGDCRG